MKAFRCNVWGLRLLLILCLNGVLFPQGVVAQTTAPSITQQPQSQSLLAGTNAAFSVTASGQSPLRYQWSFNGTNLTNSTHFRGATNATLIVSNIVAADAGDYRVVVTNSHGSATSSNAILTVLLPPAITNQPAGQSVVLSNNAAFTATASGTAPLTYHWYFNSSPMTDGGRITGSATTNLSISNVQTNDAGPYQLIVTNQYGRATSSVATLTVLVPPNITLQPSNTLALLSSNVTFAAAADGTAPLAYQWYFNGTPLTDGGRLSGSTLANLTISNLQTNDAGAYQLIVTNTYGLATSAVAQLALVLPPEIDSQPTSQTSAVNSSVSFGVSASSGVPLTYRWQKDGTDLYDGTTISGAATSTLVLSGILATNAGVYRVVVSNIAGATTSMEAVLSVVPVIIWGSTASGQTIVPASATNVVALAVGGTHVLALRADGSLVGWGDNGWGQISIPDDATNIVAIAAGELGYSLAVRADGTVEAWGYNIYGETSVPPTATNAVAVSGHTVDSMALHGDGTAGGWGYGTYGTTGTPPAASNLVAISLGSDYDVALREDGGVVGWGYNDFGAPIIAADLTNAVAISAGWLHAMALRQSGQVTAWGNNGWGQTNVPANVTNAVAIAAGHGHSIALRGDGTIVAWGDNSSGQLNVPPVATNATAIGASGGSSGALLADPSALISPRIARQPSDQNVPAGSTVIFHPVALGSLPLSYQWFHDDLPMTGQSNAWLAVRNAGLDATGSYRVLVTNPSGTATSLVATLTISPTLISQPTNQAALLGSNTVFSVTATGSAQLSYQWQRNGTNLSNDARISGADTPDLTLAQLQTNDAAAYSVLVSSGYGSVTSAVATLTVLVPAAVVGQPTNQLVLAGSNVTFSSTAIGSAPLNYFWYSGGTVLTNGGRISGATNSILTISNVQTNDAGSYKVVVTNLYGADTSAVAALTVYVPAQITGHPASVASLLGSNAAFSVAASGTALGYQWIFNGAPMSDSGRISGSTSASLNISSVQPGDVGSYTCLVTNVLSAATTRRATLTVLASPGPSVRYVSLNNPQASPPYLNWTNAAANIQDAVDAAVPGDSVVVSNGTYSVGGRAVYGTATNRVTIDKAISVQSLNGPALTSIRGNLIAAALIAGRCVYMTNGAFLAGFTLTNGSTATGDLVKAQSGGGLWCESSSAVVSNCYFGGNFAGQFGGGAFRGTLLNCLLTNNTAAFGGGACSNVLIGCTLGKNTSGRGNSGGGGGASYSTLTNCLLVANSCPSFSGGGAYSCNLTSCTVSNNTASSGGGVSSGVAINSLITSNAASSGGGGAYSNTLINCVLTRNVASTGGGAYISALLCCTVVSNSAVTGGGVWGGAATNTILYFNVGNAIDTKALVYCCLNPLAGALFSITNNPLFANLAAGDFHLRTNSPCINSGINASVPTTTDFDGNPRIVGGTVDIGAYEFQPLGRDAFNAWLQQYGLPTDGSAIYADPDHDGLNNLQEWIAGTVPTDGASVLRIMSAIPRTNGIDLVWQSVSNRAYFIERSSDLSAHPSFSVLATNVPGQDPATTFTDTTALGPGPYFYRVGVQADSNHLYTPFSVISYAWLQQYGLSTDGTADFADPDGDGMNTWQEWIAGTNPTNAASVLKMAAPALTNSSGGITLSWQSVSSRTYYVQRSSDLGAQPVFSTIQSNITGKAGTPTTTFTDTNAPAPGTFFYRVGVQH